MRLSSNNIVRSIDPAKVNRIVVVKLDHIGDVVLSTPVLDTLREAFKSLYSNVCWPLVQICAE